MGLAHAPWLRTTAAGATPPRPPASPTRIGNVVFQWTTTGTPTTQTFAFKENPTATQNQSYSFDSVACTNGGSPVTVTTVNGFFTVTVPNKAALSCVVRNKFNFNPAINVDKTANPTTVLANGNTTYTYAVTNTGNVPLSNVQLTDNRFTDACLAAPVKTGGDADAVLELGETWTYTCTRPLSQTTTNTATVTGQAANGATVQDTDDATVTVIAPAINVAKTANPNVIYAGNTVTYTFAVTNVGTNPGGAGKPPLTNITVTDPNCLAISTPVKTGGDQDDILEDAEVWTYSCSKAVSADVTNTVTAAGTPAIGPNVSDTDTAVVNVINPAIDIVKSASAPTVHVGDSVTYTFDVTNTGDDPLSNIVVLDDKCSPLSGPVKSGGDADALLETGELWPYSCIRAISATDTNTASATGTDSKGGTVTDTSSVTVNVITPLIDIAKAVDRPVVLAGATVVYTMTVTNPGNTTLQNVVVSDPQCSAAPVRTGGDTNTNNLLETTETWTYTCSSVIIADTTNTVTVTAQDTLGGSVTDTATAVVDVISPTISVTKVANPTIIRTGESTTYTLNVTNGLGTETITNVVVTDPLCAPGVRVRRRRRPRPRRGRDVGVHLHDRPERRHHEHRLGHRDGSTRQCRQRLGDRRRRGDQPEHQRRQDGQSDPDPVRRQRHVHLRRHHDVVRPAVFHHTDRRQTDQRLPRGPGQVRREPGRSAGRR